MVWPWLSLALFVVLAETAAVLMLEYRRPARASAWLVVVLALPLIGFVFYLFVAAEYRNRSRFKKAPFRPNGPQQEAASRCTCIDKPEHMRNEAFLKAERLFGMLSGIGDAPITGCNGTEVLTDGEAAFASIFEMIDKAEHHIHIAYYILRHDGVGQKFKQALAAKARKGVEVRLIYDGIGSLKLSKAYVRELEAAGIRTVCFLPPRIAFFDKRINYRYHRKIIIVDGKTGFIGGINIGDEYLGMDKRLGYWRDTHLKLEGDAVYYLQNVFIEDWELTTGERLKDSVYWPKHSCTSEERVQIIASGPDRNAKEIYECLFAAMTAARERIYVATPYFIPDAALMTALCTAAQSGLDVRLILPEVADTSVVLAATLSYAQELLPSGVKVYRYTKGFIHAKVLLVDRLVASVGTANMDLRSFFSNFELNALLFDEKPIKRLEEDFARDFADAREVTREEFERMPRMTKAGQMFARLLSPLL